ncbi:MAG: DUF2341 domain-containing protein, partial [Gammaproteobacteria bacterium]|nr:DUF2341 domain-containing protein [Gammaproteobacteria bacterium]
MFRTHSKQITATLLVMLLFLALGNGTANAVDAINLLQNSGFESGLDNWQTDNATIRTTNPNPHGATAYLYGGPDTALSYTYQTVDLVTLGYDVTAIDQGKYKVLYGGWQSGYQDQKDIGTIEVKFLDASQSIIATDSLGSFYSNSIWVEKKNELLIPAGTRSIIYGFQAERVEGSNNDGYLDDAYLYLYLSNWWDANWQYRRSMLLSNTADETIADYQMKYTISYQDGMNADFTDIRFVDQNRNKLPYWIERKNDGLDVTVWIKFPTVNATSDQKFYLYYGNSSAQSESSGVDTFDFFDDFDSLNSVWAATPQLNYQIPFLLNGENVAQLKSTGGVWAELQYGSAPTLQDGQAYSFDFYKTVSSSFHPGFINTANDVNGSRWAILEYEGSLAVEKQFSGNGWIHEPTLIENPQENTWYTGTIHIDDTDGFYLEVKERDDPSVVAGSRETGFVAGELWLPRIAKFQNTENYIDKFRIYKLPRTGITISELGFEAFADPLLTDAVSAVTDNGAGHTHYVVLNGTEKQTLQLNPGVTNAINLTTQMGDHTHKVTIWWSETAQGYVYLISDDHGHSIDGIGTKLTVNDYTTQILMDKPVAYWKLDEATETTAADSSGSNYVGTYTDSVDLGANGLLDSSPNMAVALSGNGYVSGQGSPAGADDLDEFTIEAWVTLDDASQIMSIYDQRNQGGDGNASLHYRGGETGKFRLDKFPPSNSWIESTTTPEVGQLYHVVYTEQGSTRSLYVNGVLETQDQAAETYTGQSNTLWAIGGHADDGANGWHGVIDEVSVYTQALTADQIQQHYNLGMSELFDWWDTSRQIRQKFSLSNSGDENINDYQMRYTINYNGSMNADFSDLLFVDQNGNRLPYWMERKTDGVEAVIWIKFPLVTALSTQEFYAYYGNPSALSESSGNDTFDYFDDFDELSSRWTITSQYEIPFNAGGENVAKLWSTDSSWGNMYYFTPLRDGQAYSFDYYRNVASTFHSGYLQTTGGILSRWGINDTHGASLNAQRSFDFRVEGGGWVQEALITNPKDDTWYTGTMHVDDTNGFYLQISERDDPSVTASTTETGFVKGEDWWPRVGKYYSTPDYLDKFRVYKLPRTKITISEIELESLFSDETIVLTDSETDHTHSFLLDGATQQTLTLSPGVANAITLITSTANDHTHTITVWWDKGQDRFIYIMDHDHGHSIDGIGEELDVDTYTTQVLMDKPVAYWKFDETLSEIFYQYPADATDVTEVTISFNNPSVRYVHVQRPEGYLQIAELEVYAMVGGEEVN